ncbi:hypothetical protein OBBRIDRAFT_470023 [Obba rivulosa]|uniref:Yeast cell wall synthesis Kre9/Knh1-like N-terminal domain-containing protein n=1 Tax=Obba rivulosa TaxID=1052685 RepID=A0A8E2B1X3_9APHY|nr:hypothetical protein OBBRIDRAFT_470023 [Obba rivulosa]
MRSVVAALVFVASAFAYSISSPNQSAGWTITGPNTVVWSMVSTDPQNFTIVLSNQVVSPPTQQILAALVDGSLGQMTVNPPSGGWQTGTGFRVNLVKDANDLDSILAQSDQFAITVASSSSSSGASSLASSTGLSTAVSLSSVSGGTITAPSVSTPPSATTSGTGSAAVNPSTSDTSTTPTNNAALPAMGMQAGIWSVLALLGAALA